MSLPASKFSFQRYPKKQTLDMQLCHSTEFLWEDRLNPSVAKGLQRHLKGQLKPNDAAGSSANLLPKKYVTPHFLTAFTFPDMFGDFLNTEYSDFYTHTHRVM